MPVQNFSIHANALSLADKKLKGHSKNASNIKEKST